MPILDDDLLGSSDAALLVLKERLCAGLGIVGRGRCWLPLVAVECELVDVDACGKVFKWLRYVTVDCDVMLFSLLTLPERCCRMAWDGERKRVVVGARAGIMGGVLCDAMEDWFKSSVKTATQNKITLNAYLVHLPELLV